MDESPAPENSVCTEPGSLSGSDSVPILNACADWINGEGDGVNESDFDEGAAPVVVVSGAEENFKVTRPGDLLLVEAILADRSKKREEPE